MVTAHSASSRCGLRGVDDRPPEFGPLTFLSVYKVLFNMYEFCCICKWVGGSYQNEAGIDVNPVSSMSFSQK